MIPEETISIVELPSGLVVNATTKPTLDWAGVRTLVESGVSYQDVAKTYKVSKQLIRKRSKDEAWLTPAVVESMRKEIAKKQREHHARTGKAVDVNQVKAQIWQERGERMRERSYEIIDAALGGVTQDQAKKFIKNPKGLLEMVTAARVVSGEEKEDQKAPSLAVNLAFLSSRRGEIVPITTIEAEEV